MDELKNRVYWIQTIRGCIAEFIGVGFFVLIGSLSATATPRDAQLNPAMAHGITIAILVISLGHVSGGHFNPAVTLGIGIAGGIHWLKAILYVIFQLLGGFIGALFVKALTSENIYNNIVRGGITIPNVPPQNWDEALVCEIMLTYFLVQTVLNAAYDSNGENKAAPFAIGFTVMVDVLAGGQISGASMNPARSFGPALAFQIINPKYFEDNHLEFNQWTYH